MQIIPVLDIQNGIVVRAVGGRRSDYRPLVSRLTDSTDPLALAQAIRSRYGFDEFYLADLDTIAGAAPAIATYDQLRAAGIRLWVDAGVRDATDVELIAEHADRVIIGLETLSGPSELEAMCKLFLPSPPASGGEGMGVRGVGSNPSPGPSPKRGGEKIKSLIFSLDLRDGQPLGDSTAWGTSDPLLIAERAIATGIQRMIVLDLARVGKNNGTGTNALARALIHRFAELQIYIGGGVRDKDDLNRLESLGVAGALVSSALHDAAQFF